MAEAKYLAKQFKYFDVMNKGTVNFEQFSRAIEKIGVSMSNFVSRQSPFYLFEGPGTSIQTLRRFWRRSA